MHFLLRTPHSRRLALLGLTLVLTVPSAAALDLHEPLPLRAERSDFVAPGLDFPVHLGRSHGDIRQKAGPTGTWYGVADAPDAPMRYVCPEASYVDQVRNTNTDRTVSITCPYRIYDSTFVFGSPALALHPDHQNEMAFFSLHGTPVDPEQDAPTDRSRKGDALFTTFTTGNGGLNWFDKPTGQGLPASNALAEYATGTMDSDGMLYIGYLSSMHGGVDGDSIGVRTGSLIGLYKAANVYQDLLPVYGNPFYIDNRSASGVIPYLNLVRVPVPTPEMLGESEYANETDDNQTTAGDDGEAADDSIPLNETIVAVWGETTQDATTAPNGWYGWIEAAWTHTGTGNEWARLPDEELIGPCKDFSNGAVYNGKVFVACNVAKGYEARPRARVGDIDIWSIDIRNGKTQLESFANLCCGRPLLTMTEDGYTLLSVYSFDNTTNRFHMALQYGWKGTSWHTDNRQQDHGMLLNDLASGRKAIRDAHITGVAVTRDTRTAFFVYQEWINETTTLENIDPLNPPRLTEFSKLVVAANECQGLVAYSPIELGAGLDPYNYDAYNVNPGAFNDIQDGFQVARVPGGKEIVFMLVNDYGVAQFAGLDPFIDEAECSPPGPPLLTLPAAPIASPVAQGVNTLMGATFGVAAAATLGYLLTVKRRNPNWTTVEDKR